MGGYRGMERIRYIIDYGYLKGMADTNFHSTLSMDVMSLCICCKFARKYSHDWTERHGQSASIHVETCYDIKSILKVG